MLLAFPGFAQTPQASDAADPPKMSDQEADVAIARLKEIANDADQFVRANPSSHLELQPVLEQCDYDLQKLFEWVRTETRWTPYRGALRGAAGVLMDRRGNSLDRSLLLANLLLQAGFEVRLARSELSATTAQALLDKYSGAAGKAAPSGKPGNPDVLDKQQEVAAQARDLAALAGFTEKAAGGQQTEQFLADLADHWWVQVESGNAWQDLDPMAADGKTLASEGRPTILPLDKLPDDVHHRLEIKLVIERWEAGRLVEEVPLQHEIAVDEAPSPSYFKMGFGPYSEGWASREDAKDGLSAVQIADSARFWRPWLKLNGKTIPGEWFDDSGHLEAPVTLENAKKLGAANSALSGLGGKAVKKAPPSFLTAAWLEYDTSDPGNRAQHVRREIFDLLANERSSTGVPAQLALSPAKVRDRGLALLSQTSNVELNSTPHPEALDQYAFEVFVRNKNVFIALVYLAAGREDKRVPIALAQADFRPLDLMATAALRELWSRQPDDIYIDRINLISSHQIQTSGGGGRTTAFATDIVLNRVGVMPGAALDARLARLEQGVLDTLVETRFSRNADSYNTFQNFRARANGASDWIAITDGAAFPESLPVTDSGRIRSAASNGDVVVVAPVPYEFGGRPFASWWQIDATDGTTLGRGYRGWGSEMVETLETETVATRETAPVAQELGKNDACKMLGAAAEVTVDLAAEWAAAEARARAAGRGALIDKIKAADPGKWDDLPPWCR